MFKGDAYHPARKAHLVEPDEDLNDSQGSHSSDEEALVCVHRVANRDRYPKLTAKLDINGSAVKFPLSQAERKYAKIERGSCHYFCSCKKFHQYIYGREFVLVTDHKPLRSIFGHDKGSNTGRGMNAEMGDNIGGMSIYN